MTETLSHDPNALESLQRGFEEQIPFITNLTRKVFQNLNPEALDDKVAEVLGLAWISYQREHDKGRDPDELISTIAGYATRQVRVGRGVNGQEATKDAISPSAHRKHGFKADYLSDILHDKSTAPIPDQVADKIDYREWREKLPPKKRAIADDLAVGNTTNEVAAKHGITAGAVSQRRRAFKGNWDEYQGR